MSGKQADRPKQRNRSEHLESQLNPFAEVSLAVDPTAERGRCQRGPDGPHKPASWGMAKSHIWVHLCFAVPESTVVSTGSSERCVAYLLITSLTALGYKAELFIDVKEVSMIASRPARPHAQDLSAGAELSLNDKSIIFENWYTRRISLETVCPSAYIAKAR